jgi:hypothetical protein
VHPYLLFVLIPIATTTGLVATVWKLIAKIDEHSSIERGQLAMRALLLLVLSVGATLWLVYNVHENCSYGTFQEFIDCVEVIHG